MYRRMALTGCLVGGCVWCMALVTRADSAQPASGGNTFKPVASIESLMYGQKTFYKKIIRAMKKVDDKDAMEDIEEAAEVLAELANVNRFNKNKSDYRGWAMQLRDTALQIAEEAEKRKTADVNRIEILFQQLKQTCKSCHDVYRE